MLILVVLLTLHFVGDFLLQSDWMAINKSKRLDVLAVHVAAYVSPFVVWLLVIQTATHEHLVFIAVTFAAHYLTDAVTSRITSKLWFFQQHRGIYQLVTGIAPFDERIDNPWTPISGKRHWFFVTIGFDQLLHIWQIAATVYWLGLR